MTSRNFAMVFGIVLLAIGILGFIPAFIRPSLDVSGLAVPAGAGHLLGIFPVNFVHSLVHVAAGAWGLAAMRNAISSKRYAVAMAVLFGVLTVFGVLPMFNTLFGLAPLHGNDIWLHAILAMSAGYFAYFARDTDISVRHV